MAGEVALRRVCGEAGPMQRGDGRRGTRDAGTLGCSHDSVIAVKLTVRKCRKLDAEEQSMCRNNG